MPRGSDRVGLFSREQGTDYSPNAAELWLSQANRGTTKGGGMGCQAIINSHMSPHMFFMLVFYIKEQYHAFKVGTITFKS